MALIAAARRYDVPLAVVTSAGPDWVQRAVGGTLDSLHHLEVVVTRDDVAEGKPDPAGYLLACSQLGVDAAGATGGGGLARRGPRRAGRGRRGTSSGSAPRTTPTSSPPPARTSYSPT